MNSASGEPYGIACSIAPLASSTSIKDCVDWPLLEINSFLPSGLCVTAYGRSAYTEPDTSWICRPAGVIRHPIGVIAVPSPCGPAVGWAPRRAPATPAATAPTTSPASRTFPRRDDARRNLRFIRVPPFDWFPGGDGASAPDPVAAPYRARPYEPPAVTWGAARRTISDDPVRGRLTNRPRRQALWHDAIHGRNSQGRRGTNGQIAGPIENAYGRWSSDRARLSDDGCASPRGGLRFPGRPSQRAAVGAQLPRGRED